MAKATKKNDVVRVQFEDGVREYTGPDAAEKAAEFVGKRPNDRKVLEN